MTTTNVNVGFLSDDRNSSKVLKPPGGETHDIFGQNVASAGDQSGGSQRGRNRGHLQSNVFDSSSSADVPGAGRPAATNGSSINGNSNRIFGNGSMDGGDGGSMTPARKVKDYHKSDIFGVGNDPEAMNGNLNASHRRPNANNHEMLSAVGTAYTPSKRRQFDQQVQQGYGNPITGEGYANGSAAKMENGNVSGSRGRNPPGGHSTNLW